MGHPVTLIEGNGIGPQIATAVRLAVDAAGASIDWQVIKSDPTATNSAQLAEIVDSVRATKTALMGSADIQNDLRCSMKTQLNQTLDLYVSLRPVKSFVGIESRFESVDLTVISDNLEDLLTGIEFGRTTREAADSREFLSRLSGIAIREDSAVDVRPISVLGSYQVLDFAFRHTTVTGRKKVTVVHNAGVVKATDGLFLDIAREVSKDYPNLELEDWLIDDFCLQLMQDHKLFDVLVTPALYGNFLSSLCAGMVGGLQIAPSVNLNDKIAVFGVVQRLQSDQSEQSGLTALLLSAVLMLQHLGEMSAAKNLRSAVEKVLALSPGGIDRDSHGKLMELSEMAEAIVSAISQ